MLLESNRKWMIAERHIEMTETTKRTTKVWAQGRQRIQTWEYSGRAFLNRIETDWKIGLFYFIRSSSFARPALKPSSNPRFRIFLMSASELKWMFTVSFVPSSTPVKPKSHFTEGKFWSILPSASVKKSVQSKLLWKVISWYSAPAYCFSFAGPYHCIIPSSAFTKIQFLRVSHFHGFGAHHWSRSSGFVKWSQITETSAW